MPFSSSFKSRWDNIYVLNQQLFLWLDFPVSSFIYFLLFFLFFLSIKKRLCCRFWVTVLATECGRLVYPLGTLHFTLLHDIIYAIALFYIIWDISCPFSSKQNFIGYTARWYISRMIYFKYANFQKPFMRKKREFLSHREFVELK